MEHDKESKRDWKEERDNIKRQRLSVTVDSTMCRDVRLERDPSIPVLRENAADISSECLAVSSVEAQPEDVPRYLDAGSKMKTMVFMSTKSRGPPMKEVSTTESESLCPFPTCKSTDKKLRRHIYQKHLPFLFGEKGLESVVLEKKFQSVTSLIKASLGFNATWEDAVAQINSSQDIPKTSEIHQSSEELKAMCQFKGWKEPEHFSLHPVNSPALLLHWRCMVALLLRITPEQQVKWCLEGRLEQPLPLCQTSSITPDTNESLEVTEEEFSEFVLLDECMGSDSDENNNTSDDILKAFDSHFHLDRTSQKIYGKVKTVDDIVFCKSTGHPNLPVQLVSGVIVYSEPQSYPETLSMGKWKVALGVHPKHVNELTVDRFLYLQQVAHTPEVAAIGEIGLDRTVPPKQWRHQDETFRKVLRICTPSKPVILHLRGPTDDHIGKDVHARALQIMTSMCQPNQMIHLHCFTGDVEMVDMWMKQFVNVYFGYTAAVQNFTKQQIQGLKAIPHEKLLLETDSPYMSPRGKGINTPAFIGDVGGLVAAHLDVPARRLLSITLKNGCRLYNC